MGITGGYARKWYQVQQTKECYNNIHQAAMKISIFETFNIGFQPFTQDPVILFKIIVLLQVIQID